MRVPVTFAALLSIALLATTSAAHTTTRHDYDAADKVARGLAGMVAGVVELPGNIYAVNRDEGPGAAATLGFAKGLGMIPVRELVGVFEFLTCPFPFPEGYRPILSPEYPWQYFEGAHSASFSGDD